MDINASTDLFQASCDAVNNEWDFLHGEYSMKMDDMSKKGKEYLSTNVNVRKTLNIFLEPKK